MDSFEQQFERISQIEGSNTLQTAYRLERGTNLTMMAQEAFPRGTPFQFSFECTYRERQRQADSWHLFHLTNSHEESQLTVTLNPGKETLQVTLPDARGDLQIVEFRHSSVSYFSCLLLHFHSQPDLLLWWMMMHQTFATTKETRQFNEILIVMKFFLFCITKRREKVLLSDFKLNYKSFSVCCSWEAVTIPCCVRDESFKVFYCLRNFSSTFFCFTIIGMFFFPPPQFPLESYSWNYGHPFMREKNVESCFTVSCRS